jgi:DNA polymerase I
MSDRTLVASATNLLSRGFLVVPTDRVGRAGEPVNGLFAVARAIHRVMSFKTPARAVAVIDRAAPATAWPPLLAAQLPRLAELLHTLGVHVVHAPDEPDVVASYARAARRAGDDVIVVGVDKRFAQLVGDGVWWYDANKDTRYTPEIVSKRFAVPPDKVAEWLALVGDDDALPGVTGIGAKGATALLETYGSIEGALAALDAIKGRLGNALRAARDGVGAELDRARLDAGRPLPAPLDQLAYTPPAAATVNALYDRLGFAELLVTDGAAFHVEPCATAEQVAAALARGRGAAVAVHALFDDPAPGGEPVAGIAVATGDGDAWYVAADGAAWPTVVGFLEDDRAPKLGHDLVATTVALHRRGVRLAGVVGDSAYASHLTQPSNWAPHDLALVAKHVLGRALPGDDAVRGFDRKPRPWATVPVDRAAAFAGQAADASARIWRALAPQLDAGLHAEYLELAATLVRMELTGLAVDVAELDRAELAFADTEAELTAAIEAHAGHTFNINSTKQLGSVLFEELELPVASHTKTGWSTATEALEKIAHAHPIVPLVIRWRLLRRLRDSWVIALRRAVGADGRVHSRFHPARSFSGHLVNTNPDLGRVPGRTPEMARIRRAFVAPTGRVLMSVDFVQLGLYVLAHLTRDPALVEPLRRREDLHTLTAAAVLDKPVDAVTPDDRQLGKVVNFATFAGQGASALAGQLGVPAGDASALIDRFDRHYAQVRAFQDDQLRLARDRGHVVTLAGRRWPIGGLASLDPHDRSYAERLARRAAHEGSVADVSRRALLEADRALRRAGLRTAPLLQVLDEVIFEVPIDELADAAAVAADAMRHAFELEVPLVVGVEAGPNWADLAPLA